jgi:hypothetical protein
MIRPRIASGPVDPLKPRTPTLIALIGLVLLGVVLALLWSGPGDRQRVVEDLPWDVTVLPDGGSQVFGWTLGRSSLKNVSDDLGAIPEVALFVEPGGSASAEAYFGRVRLGLFDARLVAKLAIEPEALAAMAGRGLKSKPMPSGARRLELDETDLRKAYSSPVSGLSYVPYARYDAALVEQRFGPAGERVGLSETAEYWLYPERGLAILLDDDGRDVLEYVEPRHFAALRSRVLRSAESIATD